MADILIRGMDMPRDGRKHIALLQFLEDGKCRAIVEYSKSYDDRSVKVFEAVPLPEGHGRLGDLDEMMEYIKNHEYELKSRLGCVGKGMFTYQIKEYANNHTIVPAEGGTEHG